jgi:hypothetical protein
VSGKPNNKRARYERDYPQEAAIMFAERFFQQGKQESCPGGEAILLRLLQLKFVGRPKRRAKRSSMRTHRRCLPGPSEY